MRIFSINYDLKDIDGGKIHGCFLPCFLNFENSTVFLKAWGEVDPSLWERLSQNKFAVNKNIYAKIWENLKSVSLDFYDYLIKDEIIKAESQFGLAKIICNIISKNSVSFAFLSMRAEKIISENNFKDFSLRIIEEPKEKQEIYKKVLAKVKK